MIVLSILLAIFSAGTFVDPVPPEARIRRVAAMNRSVLSPASSPMSRPLASRVASLATSAAIAAARPRAGPGDGACLKARSAVGHPLRSAGSRPRPLETFRTSLSRRAFGMQARASVASPASRRLSVAGPVWGASRRVGISSRVGVLSGTMTRSAAFSHRRPRSAAALRM